MRIGSSLAAAIALLAVCCLVSSSSPLLGPYRAAEAAAAAPDPVGNANPASTLLAPGTTSLDLSVESLAATDCAWSLETAKPYAEMTPFSGGAGSTSHSTHVSGLDPSPAALNRVYVRCASDPSFALPLIYRSIARVNPSFPRTANLWGQFNKKSAEEIARVDLSIYQSAFNGIGADLARQVRTLNPNVILLDSFNAVETGGLPEDYYLHDIHGKKIEVWSNGVYRLNLTKPYVADNQARLAYQLMLHSELRYDGMFFDNVMTNQSWVKTDMWGNPIQIDANEDGVADDPATLDAAWKAGVFREMSEFRRLMPHALVSGHSMNIREPGIAERFNGIGFGYTPSDVIEGQVPFSELWDEYSLWMTTAVEPRITFFEGSPPDQIAYGYGYYPWRDTPASTLEFARTLYPYMRFSLGMTLMNDGYFAYEFGDMWHGNYWWYDELNFDLGRPRGPAERTPQAIYRREFDNGLVLLNSTWQTQKVAVGAGWRRLKGSQAPRWEFMADDVAPVFAASQRAQIKLYDSGYRTAAAPFFHAWNGKSHLLPARTSASWRLTIPGKDVYSIDAWWPAAPAAKGWSTAARYEIWINGKKVATKKLDQSVGGDVWHRLAKLRLPAGKHTVVRLVCAGKRPCVADALYLRSKARYNDGSVAKTVVLAPMDAIVLRRAG